MKDLVEELGSRLILADGGFADSLVSQNPAPSGGLIEALCLTDPDTVLAAHSASIAAGAEILRTNSAMASRDSLSEHGLAGQLHELHWQAAQLARSAARGSGALIAGCVTGEENGTNAGYQARIGALLDGGAQLVFLENFPSLEQLLLALNVKHSLHHCPAICSLKWSPTLNVPEAFRQLLNEGAELPALCLPKASPIPTTWPAPETGLFVSGVSPADFAKLTALWPDIGLLGGGHKITPAHIAAAHLAIKNSQES